MTREKVQGKYDVIDARKTPVEEEDGNNYVRSNSAYKHEVTPTKLKKKASFDIEKEHERLTRKLRNELDTYENKPVPMEAKESTNH